MGEGGERLRRPGWYDHPERQDRKRYWDGEVWTGHTAPWASTPRSAPAPEEPAPSDERGPSSDSPYLLIVLGAIVGGVGGGMIAIGASEEQTAFAMAGYVLGAMGSVITLIGVIAAGVRMGISLAAHDRPPADD